MSRNCKSLVDSYLSRKGNRYLKKQIKKHEKIENPNILEQYQLCQDYQCLCHVEGEISEIYELCQDCECNNRIEAIKAMNDPNHEYEIIWGNVYKKFE